LSALRVTGDPGEDPLVALRSAIAVAYENVQHARRCLTALYPTEDLAKSLQRAEADLVRSIVEIVRLEREAHEIQSSNQLVPISTRRPKLPRSA
jgi:hypothetical protein